MWLPGIIFSSLHVHAVVQMEIDDLVICSVDYKLTYCQPSAGDPARVGRETNWAEKAATSGRSLTAGNGRPRQPS